MFLTNEYDAGDRVIRQTQADGTTYQTFWTQLHREKLAELAPSTVEELVDRLWKRVWQKRLHAQRDEVLALNAIRTPWAVSRFVVEIFRQRYGEQARRSVSHCVRRARRVRPALGAEARQGTRPRSSRALRGLRRDQPDEDVAIETMGQAKSRPGSSS